MAGHLARKLCAAAGLAAALALGAGASGRADSGFIPVPRIVIYPGDPFVNDVLVDAPAGSVDSVGPYIRSRDELFGKVSQRTLLPGRPIPLQAVTNPRVVRSGATVKMIYIDGGLSIETTGAALQDGGVGDFIRLRNADSGVAVEGRVQADGSVLVGG